MIMAVTSLAQYRISRNLFIPAVLSGAFVLSGALGAQSLSVYKSPHDQVEAAAAALSSQKSQSAGPLVGSVFAFPHRLAIPTFASDLLTPSLVAAEESYWRETSPGIRESDLVKALNSLATKLNLPDYAKTTDSQVRFLRMQLLSVSPQFMGRRAFSVDRPGVSEYLSPLQALHLSLVLLDQKFWDPKYQVTPAEWEKQATLTNKLQDPAQAEGQITHSIRPHNYPKAKELDDRLRASLSGLSDYEGLKIISDMFNELGVF